MFFSSLLASCFHLCLKQGMVRNTDVPGKQYFSQYPKLLFPSSHYSYISLIYQIQPELNGHKQHQVIHQLSTCPRLADIRSDKLMDPQLEAKQKSNRCHSADAASIFMSCVVQNRSLQSDSRQKSLLIQETLTEGD